MPKDTSPQTPAERPPPKLIFTWEDWLPHLADTDATEEEKKALIEALWSIVIAFVDLGWEVGGDTEAPHKSGEKTCGQTTDIKTALAAAVIDLTPRETEQEAS